MNRLNRWARKALSTLLLCTAVATTSAQPLPEVSVGRIERLANLPSRHVDARHIDVWLPADYSPARRYNVLYMHDGQMLFDASKTWNQQAWDVHLTVARLVAEQRMPDTTYRGRVEQRRAAPQ